jgi:hypothetical protein
MKYYYLIEIKEKTTSYISIEAESPEKAIEIAMTKHSALHLCEDAELEQVTIKVIREDNA